MMLKVLLSTLLLSTSLFAAEEAKKAEEVKIADPVYQEAGYNFAGVSVGIARPAGRNINSVPLRLGYGLEFSHAFMKELAVGVFASRNDGEAAKNSDVDMAITRVGVQVLYSPIADAFISLKAGVGFIDYSATVGGVTISANTDTNPIFVAPGFGIIFPITDKIQFIPNLSYTFFLENDELNSFQVFDAMGTFRYQF